MKRIVKETAYVKASRKRDLKDYRVAKEMIKLLNNCLTDKLIQEDTARKEIEIYKNIMKATKNNFRVYHAILTK